MTSKHFVWIGSVALAAVTMVFGCATGGVDFDDDDQGSGGSGGANNACGIDCASAVQAPVCKVAQCNAETGQCEIVAGPDGGECDDGQFCSVEDHCMAGECVSGGLNLCGTSPGPCDEVTCNEATQSCTTAPKASGASCTPDNPCEVNGTCTSGVCNGVPKDCLFAPVPNACHVAVCNPQTGDCEAQPGNTGSACVDLSDLCTVDKTCDNAGNCVGGTPKNCSELTVGCNDGKCDTITGDCYADPIPDGQQCAQATNDCNQGYCTGSNCLPTPINDGMGCDDGLACTAGTTCNMGTCEGGTSTIDIYFSEDFSDNAANWTLGTEWAIGPTAESTGHSLGCGSADPALDHSATADNGVAGVVLGGNASTNQHDFYWLTSPVVDTSGAPTVFLEFWRHLNSDYAPYMENRVEVFDGSAWQIVWQSGSSPGVTDDDWTAVNYDITTHKNAQMQVRFGFNVDSSSAVYTCSGWNVDDVMIASGVCNP